MSWKIKDLVVDSSSGDIYVITEFDVAGVKKSESTRVYPSNHGMTQEEFYNEVVERLNSSNSELIKDDATRAAEKEAKKAAEKTASDAFVAANGTDSDYKLKNLKDTDV